MRQGHTTDFNPTREREKKYIQIRCFFSFVFMEKCDDYTKSQFYSILLKIEFF